MKIRINDESRTYDAECLSNGNVFGAEFIYPSSSIHFASHFHSHHHVQHVVRRFTIYYIQFAKLK